MKPLYLSIFLIIDLLFGLTNDLLGFASLWTIELISHSSP